MAKKEQSYPRVLTDKHELFTFVETEKGKVVICVGNNQVSEKTFKTIAGAKAYVDSMPWELICNVGTLVAKHTFKQLKENETNS